MTRKIFKALVATVSLAALVLGTGPSMAKGHGGGRGGGGGHHFGGGGKGISVVRILAVRVSAALAWAGPLTSVAVISAACHAAT